MTRPPRSDRLGTTLSFLRPGLSRNFAVLFVACLFVFTGEARSQSGFSIQEVHEGLRLGAVAPRPDAKFDIELLPARPAIDRIKKAIDLLYRRSLFSAHAIKTLQGAGEVYVIYDPHFPKSRFSSLTIAAFFPDYYQHDGSSKKFVTVVGRYGAKWPARELAAVLAHELVGHGMQQYRGRMEHVRMIDLECEAYLYEEQAYQDLGLDKRSGEMIKFRQALEDYWCKSFRADIARWDKSKMALWERLNPDVPGILKLYLGYIDRLRKSGEAKRAIELENRRREKR